MPYTRSTAKRLYALERERRCLELRLAGATFEDIARQLNMRAMMNAYQLYRRALKRIPQRAAHEARVAILERLNRMRLNVWPRLKNATNDELPALMAAALRIEALEASLLGLNAPQKLDMVQVQDIDEQGRRQRQQEVTTRCGPHQIMHQSTLRSPEACAPSDARHRQHRGA